VSPRPPPTSTALIGSLGLLCYGVGGFDDLQHPQLALALGVLSLLFRSVYIIDFVFIPNDIFFDYYLLPSSSSSIGHF
jgi:hypothetical protein